MAAIFDFDPYIEKCLGEEVHPKILTLTLQIPNLYMSQDLGHFQSCIIMECELNINKITNYSTPASDEFWEKLATLLDFDPFMLSKLFKPIPWCLSPSKTYIWT